MKTKTKTIILFALVVAGSITAISCNRGASGAARAIANAARGNNDAAASAIAGAVGGAMGASGVVIDSDTWPGAAMLAEFGLAGLTAPPGAKDGGFMTMTLDSQGVKALNIGWTGTAAHDDYVKSRLIANGWSWNEIMSGELGGGGFSAMYTRDGFTGAMYGRNSDGGCQINVYKNL